MTKPGTDKLHGQVAETFDTGARWTAQIAGLPPEFGRDTRITDMQVLDWTKKIGSLAGGIERLIMDTPAALRRKQLEEMVAVADLVLVPVVPGAFDEPATARFVRRLDELKGIARGRKAVAIIEAIYQSAATGRTIAL